VQSSVNLNAQGHPEELIELLAICLLASKTLQTTNWPRRVDGNLLLKRENYLARDSAVVPILVQKRPSGPSANSGVIRRFAKSQSRRAISICPSANT
jgi:hypothetical protein